jgi:hypothetical protein
MVVLGGWDVSVERGTPVVEACGMASLILQLVQVTSPPPRLSLSLSLSLSLL